MLEFYKTKRHRTNFPGVKSESKNTLWLQYKVQWNEEILLWRA